MVFLPFLLASAAPVTEQAPPALAAFDVICGASETVSDVEQASRALGWVSFEPESKSEIGRLAAAVMQMPSTRFKYQRAIFRETGSSRVVLAIDVLGPNGEGSFECKLIDESAERPTDKQYLDWTGRAPTERRKSGETEVFAWAPSHLPVPTFVAVYYVPLDSNPSFPGKGLIVSSVRFYESNLKD